MTRERRLFPVITIAIILACALVIPIKASSSKVVPAATGINLIIDFENGTILNYTGLDGTTVLNVTSEVLDVKAQWTGNLAYVTAIGGVSQDQTHWWQYWVNGEYASVAANWYELNDGDSIEWKRASSAFSNSGNNGMDPSLIIGSIILSIGAIGFLLVLYKWTAKKEIT